MLTLLYRHGPSRYRLVKGYSVFAKDIQEIGRHLATKAEQLLPKVAGRPPVLHVSSRHSTITFDLGMLWLHKPELRRKSFQELHAAVEVVSRLVEQHGGRLIPAAIRPPSSAAWKPWLCGDYHFLEVADSFEREVFCNLIRIHVPTLIALTGRAGIGPNGSERQGSRRLSESAEHYATRYLASVSPRHLPRVIQCLRREGGIDKLELMDVNPLGDSQDPTSTVELRFVDSQVFLASVRAQALLFQALLIRARRLVRQGRRVGAIPQRILEDNRARAIAQGLRAGFELEEAADRGGHRRETMPAKRVASATEVALGLIEDLQEELEVLEAEYDELAPLVLGVSLGVLGYAAIQNESELLRAMLSQNGGSRRGYVDFLAAAVRDESLDQPSWIVSTNEKIFPEAARWIRYRWESTLKLGSQMVETAPKTLSPDKTGSPPAPPVHQQPHPARTANDNRNRGRIDQRAANRLLSFAKSLAADAPLTERIQGLVGFLDDTGSTDVHAALRLLEREDASDVRRRLRPPRELRQRIFFEPGDREPGLEEIVSTARRAGIFSLEIEVVLEHEAAAADIVQRLRSDVPGDVAVLLIQRTVFPFKERKHLVHELAFIHRPHTENAQERP
ncbi:MAG TPA: hypothetical protein VKM72_09395 [Thermoanaerobaculia bacterium]|nr:hypothetical protein [Thermoanaerobaculia bacterium]